MASVTDPVCGMTIEQSAAAGNATHEGVIFYFCSPACQDVICQSHGTTPVASSMGPPRVHIGRPPR